MKWFNSQSRLIQIILLLIPGVNWIVEIIVRWDLALNHKGNILNLIIAILTLIGGAFLGWVDLIWCLLFKHLVFAA